MTRSSVRYDPAKRGLDLASAIVALILLLPVQAVVAGLVMAKLGRPVIFSQQRPGRDGRIFVLRKFRTMKDANSEADHDADGDEARLTKFGRVLRSTSLDELPSLLNVITGDMSIVGPRPLLVSYLDRYSAEQTRRHEVRPGVTGLAQVSGRNALTWNEKFDLDIEYVDTRSFALDVRIIIRTVVTVLRRDGIAQDGQVTASEFLGEHRKSGSELHLEQGQQENEHTNG